MLYGNRNEYVKMSFYFSSISTEIAINYLLKIVKQSRFHSLRHSIGIADNKFVYKEDKEAREQ